ncbi:MAG: immunoglobulin-like domain-containing protein [Bulleidia sp.]
METHRKRKIRTPVKLAATALIITAVVTIGLFAFNRWQLNIELKGGETIRVEYRETFTDPGARAVVTGSLIPFLETEVEVKAVSGNVDTGKLGEYEITYESSHRKLKQQKKRKVIVEDTTPPEIILTENPDSYTLYNHPYEEEGYTASDNHDGDISDRVKVEADEEKVVYTVSDSSNNTTSVTRTIRYDDRTGPQISFPDGTDLTIYTGNGFDAGYTAVDDCDGDVTSLVSVSGSVDPNTPGTYTLTYTVSDSHNNTTELTRTITVRNRPTNSNVNNVPAKTIYLTFDDGPGASTGRLLDILDQYNVKATFFTTSMYGYTDYIGEEARRGHTVAVHTLSHNYANVYSTTDAYWADFDAQNEVIRQQTGNTSSLFRFPGGSSNTVSANYCAGIMGRLVDQSYEKNLVYFDWNVSSGDAGSITDTNVIIQNIKNGITACTNAGVPSIVLQHDYKSFTVDAVEPVIVWALENGYEFAPLSAESYIVHHGLNN